MAHTIRSIFVALAVALFVNSAALAQTVPGPADAARIEPDVEKLIEKPPKAPIIIPEGLPEPTPAPAGAENISFLLKEVEIEGMTAFSRDEMADTYQTLLGRDVPLSVIWGIADNITRRYQSAGYFLSRAFVPQQEIEQGRAKIKMVEGYIREVEVEGRTQDHRIVQALIEEITGQRPIKLYQLERALLLFNDFYGVSYQAVLDRIEEARDGAIRLVLKEVRVSGRGVVAINNHGSRFTGPHRVSFAHETSFVPLHKTTLSGTASLPGGNEVWALNAAHSMKVAPDKDLFIRAGRTKTEPGYTLAANELESTATDLSFGGQWQIIRQRNESLLAALALEVSNIETNILGTPLTRDRIRALRGAITYGFNDFCQGNNIIQASLTQGIPAFGASEEGDSNLSREEAEPDFTKLELGWDRQILIRPEWLVSTSISGQVSSRPLYSSEEFGFGGPYLGRAYDASEITGDHGIAASAEVMWLGLPSWYRFKANPYLFFDIGKVWNKDDGQGDPESAASAGVGFNITHERGLFADLSLALPSREISTPVYGNNGENPRLFFQLGYRY